VQLGHTTTGSGTDVVLLHGVGLDRSMWDRCVPLLVASGHRVTSVDLRGHGNSGPAESGTALADLASDVTQLLDSLGNRPVHLVGFSLGALVGQYVAATRPDSVATLALVSSVALRTTEERTSVRGRLQMATEDLEATVDAAVQRWFDQDWQRRDPELVAAVRRAMLANAPSSYLACYTVLATGDLEVGPLLDRITAPTLAITGSDDPGSTPEMAERLADAIPDARAEIIVGARHLLPLERPRELTEALVKHFERTRP
jgi:pimeloyl-ACP methyl ester carboxylesterase